MPTFLKENYLCLCKGDFFVSKSNHLEPFAMVWISRFSAYSCLLIVLTAYIEQTSKWEVIYRHFTDSARCPSTPE